MQKVEFLEKLGLLIKMERLKKKLSQEQLAALSDCGLSQIGTVERGEKGISFYNFYKIAKILDINVNELIANIERK